MYSATQLFKKYIQHFLLSLLLISISAWSASPLPIDQAFSLSAKLFGNDTVVFSWKIAPNHYLYKERFAFKVIQPAHASIGTIILPSGEPHEDEIFGKYEAYRDNVTIPVPIIGSNPQKTILAVSYQGCSADGYCYPPVMQKFNINFAAGTLAVIPEPAAAAPAPVLSSAANSQTQHYISLLTDAHLITILLAFLGFGILLSFTPCVLPMLPILSGIILGHKENMTSYKAFWLSLTYVLSMAITYAIAGILVGFVGRSVQTLFQQPWLLILSSLIFVLLALSFFGFYQLKLPNKLEDFLANLSRKQTGGKYIGVAIMGCLATLIVSPCVTPALVGVLGYIGKTGNATLGGLALFFMGLGMGIPLIFVGTAGGKLLPKAGHWMETLEACFGVLFLGMAILMLDRILPPIVTMILWAALLIISAIYMGALSKTPASGWGKLWKGSGLIFLIYGGLLLVGAAQGNTNVFQPLTNFSAATAATSSQHTLFTRIDNAYQLQKSIALAKAQGKPIMLDFYADWCIACKEMEQTTFKDPTVTKLLSTHFVTLQIDITQNNAQDKKFMQQFGVIAPPTLIFINAEGKWLKNLTLVGKMNAADLLTHLKNILQS